MKHQAPLPGQLCRICGSEAAREVGAVEFYQGYNWPIHDCAWCGCRFTRHDESFYKKLHTDFGSSYVRYRQMWEECRKRFQEGNAVELRRYLATQVKYRLVLDEIDRLSPGSKVLEIGCSRGYLASYAILSQHRTLGVDISLEALDAAREAFGNHFATVSSSAMQDAAPYDFIYHTGTIGCVADPIALTHSLLALLKPGCRLVFNAPNLGACDQLDQLWLEAAPPPDVVTLFPFRFWKRQFQREAKVEEKIEMAEFSQSFPHWIRKRIGLAWEQPIPLPIGKSSNPFLPTTNLSRRIQSIGERIVTRVAAITGLGRIISPKPADFGLLVTMTKKD